MPIDVLQYAGRSETFPHESTAPAVLHRIAVRELPRARRVRGGRDRRGRRDGEPSRPHASRLDRGVRRDRRHPDDGVTWHVPSAHARAMIAPRTSVFDAAGRDPRARRCAGSAPARRVRRAPRRAAGRQPAAAAARRLPRGRLRRRRARWLAPGQSSTPPPLPADAIDRVARAAPVLDRAWLDDVAARTGVDAADRRAAPRRAAARGDQVADAARRGAVGARARDRARHAAARGRCADRSARFRRRFLAPARQSRVTWRHARGPVRAADG